MARPRTFDEDALLTNVMHLFRRQGYQATSVRDLEAATGLTSGSLYNTYGDKRGLFEAASAFYNRKVLLRRIDQHAPPGSGLNGLKALFLSLLEEPGGMAYGCLITNSAVEFGREHCPSFVTSGLAVLEKTCADRLSESLQGPATEAEATALLALYQGTLVLFRSGQGTEPLRQMISQVFDNMEKRHGF